MLERRTWREKEVAGIDGAEGEAKEGGDIERKRRREGVSYERKRHREGVTQREKKIGFEFGGFLFFGKLTMGDEADIY